MSAPVKVSEMQFRSFEQTLIDSVLPEGLQCVLLSIAKACAQISAVVRGGELTGSLGSSGHINVQSEDQKALDLTANEILSEALTACPQTGGFASEELERAELAGRLGGYLVLFDPLDGSSNVDVNVSVGTIFSVVKAPAHRQPTEQDFLQSGRMQVAAGYAIYGPQTMLVVGHGSAISGFTLDEGGVWRCTHPAFSIPERTQEFAINVSNYRHWEEGVRSYVDGCLAGVAGPRGKDFNMRWVASMVADVHRILMRGGVFIYPWDDREPSRPGKLRLMYEANPMALLMEAAGGSASDGVASILDIYPHELHQRVPVMLGSAEEVATIVEMVKPD